jgi:FkbM family methyltransferase
MNFNSFQEKREEHVQWITANGFNEGDCEKNGEFSTLMAFRSHYDFFIDIGANNGIFIDRLNDDAVLSNRPFVLAFEPNPNLGPVLEKKIIRGNLVQSALSNKKGKATFNIYSSDDTTSSLFDRSDMMPHFTNKVTQIEVDLEVLNTFLPIVEKNHTKGVFLKIDAEGGELSVLEGATLLLEKLPLVFMMFEYSPAWKIGNHELKSAFHLLDNLGFRIFRITPLGLEALRFYTADMEGPDFCNYFAVKGIALSEILNNVPIRSATHNWNDFYLFT